MYARTTMWRGNPQGIDDAVAYARDEVMPMITAMDGSAGMSMLCDRESGRCVVATSWQTEEAMRASAEKVRDSRDRAGEILGDPNPEVAMWEIALMHRKRDTPEGACCRVTWSRGDAAGADGMLQTFRMGVLPRVDDLPGFCSVSILVDRASGMSVLTATYESREAMERTAGDVAAMRERFNQETGVEVTDMAEMELALHHLRVPETV
jgi:hypothetical protein